MSNFGKAFFLVLNRTLRFFCPLNENREEWGKKERRICIQNLKKIKHIITFKVKNSVMAMKAD